MTMYIKLVEYKGKYTSNTNSITWDNPFYFENPFFELSQVGFKPTTFCFPGNCSTNWDIKAAQLNNKKQLVNQSNTHSILL